MKKNKILLTTIRCKKNYVQLGLYNLKAYVLRHNPYRPSPKIIIKVFSARSYTNKQGIEFPTFTNPTINRMVDSILKKDPVIVGFSCFVWNIESILVMVKIIKEKTPQIKIILGGAEVSCSDHAEDILRKEKSIDIIVRDEGEETFLELMKSIIYKKMELTEIRSISYRKNGHIQKNPDRSPIDLSRVPSPYLQGLIDLNKDHTLTIETSRGCPFKCAYCSFSVRVYNKLRSFPIEKIDKELNLILKKNPESLWINDDNFNINREKARQILKIILNYKKNTKIRLFLHASSWPLEKELVNLLAKGRVKAMIGVQSVNKKALRLVNRINNMAILERNLRILDKKKVAYVLEFIIGLPGDTYEDIKSSIDWALQFHTPGIAFFPLMVLSGTALYQRVKVLQIKHNLSPPYIVYRTGTMSKRQFQKALSLSRTLSLFYERLFLKKTMYYLNQELKLRFSDIFEGWILWNKMLINEKDILSNIQEGFIKYLLRKYQKLFLWEKIEPIVKKDLKIYCQANKIS